MNMIDNVIITEDVSLIVFHGCPADISFIDTVFQALTNDSINVDMISATPPQGNFTSLSFTIADVDLKRTLEVIAALREKYTMIKPMISSGNSKIQVCGEEMRNAPGIASLVFSAVASVSADIRLITTSEIDISLLVTKADELATYDAIVERFS